MRSTIDWRIYELTKKHILFRLSRGIYSLYKKNPDYIPSIDNSLITLHEHIHQQFPFTDFCLWTTKWLNEFMLHQPGHFYTLLDVEKTAMESVFYFLKDQGNDVFLNPSEEILDKYTIHIKNPIIISRLTTEAPIQKTDNINTATLEKIIVDIFTNPVLFSSFHGRELKRIFETAFEKYNINEFKIFRYASRRGKKKEIKEYLDKVNAN